MRRVFLMLSACLVMSLMFASAAMSQTDPSESPYGTLCGSFGSQFGAQQYYDFNATAEEQTIMDVNGDGLACTPEDGNIVVEELTGAPAENPDAPVGEFPGLTPPIPAEDVVEIAPGGPCATPEIQSDVVGVPVEELANAYVNRNDPVGVHISSPLDPDGNGIACDHPGATTGTVPATDDAAVDQYADDDVADEDVVGLPNTGGPVLLFPIAGLALISSALIIKRRLS